MSESRIKSRRLLATAIIITAGILIWSLYNRQSGLSARPVPEYVFTYAENQSSGYPTAMGAQYFADLVYEQTDGRIKINVYTDAELGNEPAVWEQLRYGGIDFARVSVMAVADEVNILNILQLPYLYSSQEHMWKVLDGEIGSEFLAALDGNGVVGLSWYDAGARHFYNRVRPISRLEDLKGLRIRVAESRFMADTIRSLGAIPVTVTYEGVYSAFETGVIDGAENNWPSYESKRHWEVSPYITLDAHNKIPEVQLCSQSTWDCLDRKDQEIIRRCAQESAVYERLLWNRAETAARKRLTGKCTITELSNAELARFREAVQPVYNTYASDYTELVTRIRQCE